MTKPLRSNFATNNTLDSKTTLFSGKASITTPVLTAELSADETEEFFVDEAKGAANQGFAIIEDEVIFYSSKLRNTKIRYLKRGQNNTTPAVHAVSTPVTFTPLYYLPEAIVDAIIAMQEKIVEHENRVGVLETVNRNGVTPALPAKPNKDK